MRPSFFNLVLLSLICCAHTASLHAAPTFNSGSGTKRAYLPSGGNHGGGSSRSLDPNRVKLTIQVNGANERERASIKQTLTDSGLRVKFHEPKNAEDRLAFSVESDRRVDLNQFVRGLNAPLGKPAQDCPTYELLVFGDFDVSPEAQVRQALGHLKGIDATSSAVDSNSGELRVRLTGSDPVTADNIRIAMKSVDNKIAFKRPSRVKAPSPSRLSWLSNYHWPSWLRFERKPEPQQSEQ